MKFPFKYIILPGILFLAVSCSDFLVEDPDTFYSEQSIFSTEEGVKTAINGVFSDFSSPQYYGTSWHNLTMPVSGLFFSTQAANRDVVGLNTNPSNKWVNDLWAQAYKAINSANIVIKNLEETDLDLPNKQTALGEAYFLRGVTYFDLARLFGGVPLRTIPTVIEEIHLPRASRAEVIDQVIQDFDQAKALLPKPSDSREGRPANLAANVYLAKVYMTLAGEDGGDPAYWSMAYDEIIEVYNSNAYSLTPTFAELFVPGNENTAESIFELQYDHTGGIRNSDMIRSFTPSNSIYAPTNVTTFGRIRPNKEVFDAFVEQYPGDPRIDATFLYDEYEKATGGTQKIYPTNTTGNQGFPVIAKWFDPTYNGTTTARNLILLRYADVLLMLAEIENELNGPDNAYQYVNQVLARARDTNGDGMSDADQPADWSSMSQELFRERIMKERLYELLSEGQEWFDTRRRGYVFFLENVVEVHNSHPTLDLGKEFIYPIGVKNMLLPIPLSEISGNTMVSVADQNPGY